MRSFIAACVLGASLWIAAPAAAQVPVVTYYVPAPVVAVRPVAPLPSYTTYYYPSVPAYPAAAYYAPPAVVGRPAVSYYSPYGGLEVRVPGQPVRNFLRAVIP